MSRAVVCLVFVGVPVDGGRDLALLSRMNRFRLLLVLIYCVVPAMAVMLLSDPVHGFERRLRVGFPAVVLWLLVSLLVTGLDVTKKTLLSGSVVVWVLAIWGGRLDYSQVDRISMYGLPLMMLAALLVWRVSSLMLKQ